MKQMHKHEAQVQSQSPARRLSVVGLGRFGRLLGTGSCFGCSSYAATSCTYRMVWGAVCDPVVWPRSSLAFVGLLALYQAASGDNIR